MKELPDLSPRQALQALLERSGDHCENFTSGIGSCFRNGRRVYARFGADAACASCIAAAALRQDEVTA